MLIPAVPFLACVWAHVFTKAPNGPYMVASVQQTAETSK
jgi:hypothetical protein